MILRRVRGALWLVFGIFIIGAVSTGMFEFRFGWLGWLCAVLSILFGLRDLVFGDNPPWKKKPETAPEDKSAQEEMAELDRAVREQNSLAATAGASSADSAEPTGERSADGAAPVGPVEQVPKA